MTQIGMFRPIRMDHTNCLQVAIKTLQLNNPLEEDGALKDGQGIFAPAIGRENSQKSLHTEDPGTG